MDEFLVKHIVNNYLSSHTSRDKNGNDFFKQRVVTTDRRGKQHVTYKERGPPPGISATDKNWKICKRVMSRAKTLDNAINIMGFRVGWGAIVAVVPFVGDFFDSVMAYWVYREACSIQPPLDPVVKSRMLTNIAIDFLIGLVPFLGDLADAMFRCNTMNAALLYGELEKRGKKNLATQQANQGAKEIRKPDPTKSKGGNFLDRIMGRSRDPDPERAEGGYRSESRRRDQERQYGQVT